jgi:hypothetical protein
MIAENIGEGFGQLFESDTHVETGTSLYVVLQFLVSLYPVALLTVSNVKHPWVLIFQVKKTLPSITSSQSVICHLPISNFQSPPFEIMSAE